jgi:hypothetical protein
MSNDIELDEPQPTGEILSSPTNSRLIIIGIAGMILGAFTCPASFCVTFATALSSDATGFEITGSYIEKLWFVYVDYAFYAGCFAPILGFVVSAVLAVVFGKMVYAVSENKSLAYGTAFAITVIYGVSPFSGVSNFLTLWLVLMGYQ